MKKAATASASDITNGDVSRLTSFPPLERTGDNEDSVTCVENVVDSMAKTEIKEADAVNGGVGHISRPPSPPSGTQTPSLRLEECPPRLRPQIPPPNYGAVKPGLLFRSAFPQDRNLDFLEDLNIRTILSFVPTEPSEKYTSWLHTSSIIRHRIDIAPNKSGRTHVQTSRDSLCEALLLLLDRANYPLYLHCNQGRHRTGCVVACLRKIQRWPIEDVLDEYRVYASPKVREGDVELIRRFEPEWVFQFAKERGYLDQSNQRLGKWGRPGDDQSAGGFFMKRMDSSIADIDALAEALGSPFSFSPDGPGFGDGGTDLDPAFSRVSSTTGSLFSSSSASDEDGDGLEMRHSAPTVIDDDFNGPRADVSSAPNGTAVEGILSDVRSDSEDDFRRGRAEHRIAYSSLSRDGGGDGGVGGGPEAASSNYMRGDDGGWDSTTATVTELADDAMTPPPDDAETKGDPFG
ncbi:hypothetical protein KC340_g18146 [Hortaea werneckii]|nr:hypothetical protein KC342_g17569 [Hortaea werneckii]KAI7057758.1 hypothetical protein KC339_g17829 [Hortaea werneckii]KAI7287146.1 hypothetical protein KC340_g18146 [Hortaea werneckii]KAI7339620.1 hypothetical protein KC354_g17335 [Hortaea werneckii]KAI7372397.1 hypothetical protein KC328_g17277 [Hortaea werneckii]